ncbi:MAG: Luciferase-like, subgroup [Actinomycetia bacterium]|nr:Luciferase-like, subgroup [Actinomycetes bacterium]
MVAFGVHVGLEGASVEELRQAWCRAEALGFEWISVNDHFLPMLQGQHGEPFEAVACHAALAAETTRARVGSLVYGVAHRHPTVLAAAASTIDHLSDGRLELGLGAGFVEAEHAALGLVLEAPAVRLRRLAEATTLIRLLWSGDVVDLAGEFYDVRGARVRAPVQRPPRIWLGLQGERLGLPLAGRLADGWNCGSASAAAFGRKRSIVLDHAEDPDAMATSVSVDVVLTGPGSRGSEAVVPSFRYARTEVVAGGPAEVCHAIGAYVEAGADWVVVRLAAPLDLEQLDRFAAEVVPAFS